MSSTQDNKSLALQASKLHVPASNTMPDNISLNKWEDTGESEECDNNVKENIRFFSKGLHLYCIYFFLFTFFFHVFDSPLLE